MGSSVLQKCYLDSLHDLGSSNGERFAGIFSPIYSQSIINRFITTYFTEKAEQYDENHQLAGVYGYLLDQAFNKINYDIAAQDGIILDIGSGAGNTIIPLCQRFPNASIFATDLSIELLRILKQGYLAQNNINNVHLIQLNAEELNFLPESIDLVIGAAILHHLHDPEKVIAKCSRILKPGSYAIFFEPFENGCSILRIIFETILAHPQAAELAPEIVKALKGLIRDFDVRKGADKSLPIFSQIDDKWLFTRQYFFDLAEKYQFSSCKILSNLPPNQCYEKRTASFLQEITDKPYEEALPDWAWEICKKFDGYFSDELKQELFPEGRIILKK